VAIDSAGVDGDVRGLLVWLALLALDFVLLAQVVRFGSWYGQLGAETMQHQLRTRVTDRLLHPRARADRLPGSALSLATNDVRQLTSAVSLMVYPVGEAGAARRQFITFLTDAQRFLSASFFSGVANHHHHAADTSAAVAQRRADLINRSCGIVACDKSEGVRALQWRIGLQHLSDGHRGRFAGAFVEQPQDMLGVASK